MQNVHTLLRKRILGVCNCWVVLAISRNLCKMQYRTAEMLLRAVPTGMLSPRGQCGLEAKFFGLGLGLGLVVSGLGLVLGLTGFGLGLTEVGLVAS